MQKFTEDQLKNIKIAKSISKFLGEKRHDNQMLYLLSIHEYTISWQPLMKLIKKFDALDLDCPFYQEACDRIDAAVTTYDINKTFAEVAKAIMWYDLAYMSNNIQKAKVSDTTEVQSSNADHQIKISEIKEKFFKELCKYDSIDGDMFRSDVDPIHLFEWFKPYLQGTIDWEGLEDVIEDAYNKSTMPTEGGYGADTTSLSELQKHLINLLKTNLPNYIK